MEFLDVGIYEKQGMNGDEPSQIKTNFEFRRINFNKVQKISNQDLGIHLDKKEQFETSPAQEFRRKIPRSLQSKIDKEFTGWGTDLDCFVKSPEVEETNLDVQFKCEFCNFSAKYQSYMNQHYESDIHKNNLKKSLNQNEDKNETLEFGPNLKELQKIMKNILDTVIAHEDQDGREISEPFIKLDPEYYKIIENPIDLSGIFFKIEAGNYQTMEDLENDFNLLCHNVQKFKDVNSLEYNDSFAMKLVFKNAMKEMNIKTRDKDQIIDSPLIMDNFIEPALTNPVSSDQSVFQNAINENIKIRDKDTDQIIGYDNWRNNKPIFKNTKNDNIITKKDEIIDFTPIMDTALTNQVPDKPVSNPMDEISDPFDPKIRTKLLTLINLPVEKRHGYISLENQKIPNIRPHSNVFIGGSTYVCKEAIGQGAFGKIFKAQDANRNTTNDAITADIDIVLKVQKDDAPWDFYICTEIHQRLNQLGLDSKWFMSIPRCYVFKDGCIFVSKFQTTSLLDICNLVMQMDKTNVEPIAMYFTIEMLNILEKLHKSQIIHGDIKPDNFLIQREIGLNTDAPDADSMFKDLSPTLEAIDFGISIDMSLFPKDQTFDHQFDKVNNRCPEMLQKKSWNYHLDYFGVAGIAHTLLHGSYMKISKRGKSNYYSPNGSFKRWWDGQLWTEFFHKFLNIGDEFPNVPEMRLKFESAFFHLQKRHSFEIVASELNKLIRNLKSKDQNCDVCSKSFSTTGLLNQHKKNSHGRRKTL